MTVPELQRGAVRLRVTESSDVEELRHILHTPEVRARWGDDDRDSTWPFDYPEATRYTIFVDDRIVGLIQFDEENEPMYRHASIDLYLDPAVHGRGVGRTAVYLVADQLIRERGHHRVVIDPAADNVAAIRCYAAVGFKPVGIMRRYERDIDGDGWHDGLLMEMLAGELVYPGELEC